MSILQLLLRIRGIPAYDRCPAISDQELDELIKKFKEMNMRGDQ